MAFKFKIGEQNFFMHFYVDRKTWEIGSFFQNSLWYAENIGSWFGGAIFSNSAIERIILSVETEKCICFDNETFTISFLCPLFEIPKHVLSLNRCETNYVSLISKIGIFQEILLRGINFCPCEECLKPSNSKRGSTLSGKKSAKKEIGKKSAKKEIANSESINPVMCPCLDCLRPGTPPPPRAPELFHAVEKDTSSQTCWCADCSPDYVLPYYFSYRLDVNKYMPRFKLIRKYGLIDVYDAKEDSWKLVRVMEIRKNTVYVASPFRAECQKVHAINVFSDKIAKSFTHSPKMELIDLEEGILIPGIDFDVKNFVEDVYHSSCVYEDNIPKNFWEEDCITFLHSEDQKNGVPIYHDRAIYEYEATCYNDAIADRLPHIRIPFSRKDAFQKISQDLVYPPLNPKKFYNVGWILKENLNLTGLCQTSDQKLYRKQKDPGSYVRIIYRDPYTLEARFKSNRFKSKPVGINRITISPKNSIPAVDVVNMFEIDDDFIPLESLYEWDSGHWRRSADLKEFLVWDCGFWHWNSKISKWVPDHWDWTDTFIFQMISQPIKESAVQHAHYCRFKRYEAQQFPFAMPPSTVQQQEFEKILQFEGMKIDMCPKEKRADMYRAMDLFCYDCRRYKKCCGCEILRQKDPFLQEDVAMEIVALRKEIEQIRAQLGDFVRDFVFKKSQMNS
jgi:hypothetical protein